MSAHESFHTDVTARILEAAIEVHRILGLVFWNLCTKKL